MSGRSRIEIHKISKEMDAVQTEISRRLGFNCGEVCLFSKANYVTEVESTIQEGRFGPDNVPLNLVYGAQITFNAFSFSLKESRYIFKLSDEIFKRQKLQKPEELPYCWQVMAECADYIDKLLGKDTAGRSPSQSFYLQTGNRISFRISSADQEDDIWFRTLQEPRDGDFYIIAVVVCDEVNFLKTFDLST